MSYTGKAASFLVLFIVASTVVSKANLLGAVKIDYTTPADNVRAYKLMNIPPNSTGSCKSRFGEGAQAGKLDCECKGGFMWNETKTQCVSDGTPAEISYFERITMRMFRNFGIQSSKSSSSSQSSVVTSSAPSSLASSKPAGCFVKGTVTATGERYYYHPGCLTYDSIVIDLSRNEKRFCSEELAEKAGWKKSPMCI